MKKKGKYKVMSEKEWDKFLHKELGISRQEKKPECMLPLQIMRDYYSPGLFFGLPPNVNEKFYIGMAQGCGTHSVVFGGSGSGKSTGIVNPTMKTWDGIIFVTDIKGEHFSFYDNLYRNKSVKRPYIVLNLKDDSEYSIDLFWWAKNDDKSNLTDNIREIAYALVPEGYSKDKFWEESERSILTAALLFYEKSGFSFIDAIKTIAKTSIFDLCTNLTLCGDPDVTVLLGSVGMIKPDTLALIGTTLTNHISVFASSEKINNIFKGPGDGGKCFTWDDLEEYNVFLSIPEDKLEQWGGIVNLIYTQLIHYLMRRPDMYSPEGTNTVPVLLLMDEVAQFGKLKILPNAIATLRSRNVSICLLLQSLAQLDKNYGELDRRIILENCAYKAILGASDPETQRFLCDLIGKTKILSPSISENFDSYMNIMGYGTHISQTCEYLIQPDELAYLKDVILLTPFGRYRIRKFQTYDIFHELYFPVRNNPVQPLLS